MRHHESMTSDHIQDYIRLVPWIPITETFQSFFFEFRASCRENSSVPETKQDCSKDTIILFNMLVEVCWSLKFEVTLTKSVRVEFASEHTLNFHLQPVVLGENLWQLQWFSTRFANKCLEPVEQLPLPKAIRYKSTTESSSWQLTKLT